jgi:hypothetical protein
VSQPFCTSLVSGTLPLELYPPKYVQLFTDAKQLSKKLINALPSGPDKDTFSLDRIDFTRQVLLSIEWGPNSDCGPVLQVNDIQVNANRITIDVTQVEPPPDTMRRAAISSAFAYVLLPR